MSDIGRIGWIDMTTDNAEALRDFYSAVVGWSAEGVSMGDYNDFVMKPPGSGDGVAGVCHSRGTNADQPPGWMIYITVADLDASVSAVAEHGGKIVVAPRGLAGGRFCVIEDPGGSIAALYQP